MRVLFGLPAKRAFGVRRFFAAFFAWHETKPKAAIYRRTPKGLFCLTLVFSLTATAAPGEQERPVRDVPKTATEARWEGVDKTVIEKFAADAGHAAREPFIPTDQGDLLLFLFLLAGAAGGFVAGYAFRGLFPPQRKRSSAEK